MTSTMVTVCLIIPPSLFLLDERVFMTLGILKIAAVLEQFGIIMEMLDLSGVGNYLEAISSHAAASDAKIFGLTATTPQMLAVRQNPGGPPGHWPGRQVDSRRSTRDARPGGGQKGNTHGASGPGGAGPRTIVRPV